MVCPVYSAGEKNKKFNHQKLCKDIILNSKTEVVYIDSKNQGQYQIQIERDFEACSATNQLVLEDGSNKLFVMTAGGFNNVNLTKKLIDNIDLIVMDEIHHLDQ
mgnify:CR=1 FL=1